MTTQTYREVEKYLHSLSNPTIAEHSQGFFKTGEGEYGYGDKFLGIRVPVIRKAVQKYKKTSLGVAENLLQSEYHEIRLFALLLLVSQFSTGNSSDKKLIFQRYLNNTQFINNWDLVDSSAHHIIGAYLSDKNRSLLYTLAKSDSLWERRIAIIATYHFIKNNDFKDTLKIAKSLLNDEEDLIHKASGWMLRETGKRNLHEELAFLNKYYKKMPRTMLRYAIEKFSKETRQRYLTGLV